MKKYACVAENSEILINRIKEENNLDYLLIVGEKKTPGLARDEYYNLEGLTNSIKRASSDIKIAIPTRNVALIESDNLIQKSFLFVDAGLRIPFVVYADSNNCNNGILIYGESKNHLAVVMGAYGLPFPENFR